MTHRRDQREIARSPWRDQIVPHLPAILIRRAKEGRTISYTELAQTLEDRHGVEAKARKTLYGPPVYAVALAIQALGVKWEKRIPPLTAIVVQASTGLPALGADDGFHYFFRDRGRGMAKGRTDYLRSAIRAVFDYGDQWDEVRNALRPAD